MNIIRYDLLNTKTKKNICYLKLVLMQKSAINIFYKQRFDFQTLRFYFIIILVNIIFLRYLLICQLNSL